MALPFNKPKPADDVPIVGQPLGLHGWSLVLAIECKCGALGRGPMLNLVIQSDHMGQRTAGIVCPDCHHLLYCKRVYTNKKGDLVFDVDRADQPQTAPPVARVGPPSESPSP